MNILICDDMQTEADKLKKLIANSGFEINTVAFYNANDALDFIRLGKRIDVCFLDIIMPDMDGITLAAELRSLGYKGQIVFLSTSREYGPEAVALKTFSYLLKPPTQDSVNQVLYELDESQKLSDTGGILVKSVGFSRLILFKEISHIEVIKHNVYFQLTDHTQIVARVTFAEVALQLLKKKRFVQCHRSYIVNMDEVSAVQGTEYIMHSGAVIPISKSYLNAKECYFEWVLGGDEK